MEQSFYFVSDIELVSVSMVIRLDCGTIQTVVLFNNFLVSSKHPSRKSWTTSSETSDRLRYIIHM